MLRQSGRFEALKFSGLHCTVVSNTKGNTGFVLNQRLLASNMNATFGLSVYCYEHLRLPMASSHCDISVFPRIVLTAFVRCVTTPAECRFTLRQVPYFRSRDVVFFIFFLNIQHLYWSLKQSQRVTARVEQIMQRFPIVLHIKTKR